MTKVIRVENDFSVLDEAAERLASGGLVAFPTETVYGLGANALNEEGVAAIFVAKGRPQDNPLIVHISDKAMLGQVVSEVPPAAEKLMDAFWPGPLTIVLKKSETIPASVTAGLGTVGVRMPSHPVARLLIEKSGVPVAAPSANVSGRPSTTRAEHVVEDLSGRVDYIIDGGASEVGLESTVLDMTGDVPQILRPGGVSLEELQVVLGEVVYEPALKDSREVPKSPGMKYRHYAPIGQLYLIQPGYEKSMIEKLTESHKMGQKTGVLCCGKKEYPADVLIDCGKNADSYATHLFDALRQMDEQKAEVIFAELPQDDGGIVPALMNRMLKASGGQVLSDEVTVTVERL